MEKRNKKKYLIISVALILLMFHLSYGFEIILPSNINWLMTVYHDWGQHYLGWAYFQKEPWHLPIGAIENYNFPAGTNVGFTDSIPLLAIFFKTISFLLPETFQYFGIWFLSCHLLMGYFTFKVFNLYTKNYWLIVLAVLLISFNPVLMYRGMHPALCAQWLIMASIYYYLVKPLKENVQNINKKQLLILVLSALINPYLFLMIIGFSIILPFKNYYFDKLISLKQVFYYIFSGLFTVFVCWFLIGMVSFSTSKTMEVENSYGLYGFNLNSFYNSFGWSTFFPTIKIFSPSQYEGFSYLGLGFFIIIIIGIIYLLYLIINKSIQIKKHYKFVPFFLLLLVTIIFAITNKVTINDSLLFEYYLPEFIVKIGNIFRASGRFIWIFYYTLFSFFLIVFFKIKIHNRIKVFFLIFITLIQFYDIKLFLNKQIVSGNYEIKPLNEKKWTEISSNFDKIITYPLYNNSLGYSLDYQDWCFIALKNDLPITNGYVARESGDKNVIFQQKIKDKIKQGEINSNELYITTSQYLSDFNSLIYNQKVHVGFLNEFYYIYSRDNKNMLNHEFEEIELFKADSLFNKIKELSKIQTIIKPNIQEDIIQYNIESLSFSNNILSIQGWAFLKNNLAKNDNSIFISLTNNHKSYLFNTIKNERLDVATHFKNENIKNSGFKTVCYTDKLIPGMYSVLIGTASDDNILFQSASQQIIEIKKEIQAIVLTSLPENSDNMKYNIEGVSMDQNMISINGWAFIVNKSSVDSNIKIILEGENINYSINVFNINRPDVTSHFNQNINFDNSGFKLVIKKEKFNKGNYKIGILITNENENSYFMSTNKKIKI
jgi:hypothetical protein